MGERGESVIHGFIIVGPGFPVEMGFNTFGRTVVAAWERHMGPLPRDAGERATIRSRWAQKGWRPIEARMVIPIPPAPEAGPR